MSLSNSEKVALTPAEFAALFGKSQTWGYRQLYSGKVKALTGYGRTLIPTSEVERLLSKAGRYLGANTNVEKIIETPRKAKKTKRRNLWRDSIKRRRSVKGLGKKKLSTSQLTGLRNSALRKMNRIAR